MKVVIIAGYSQSLVNFRGDLIKSIVGQGHDVIAVGPEEGFEKELTMLGARFSKLFLKRNSINPLDDFSFFLRIYRFFKTEKPDIVISYTIKPVIYGSIAARIAGIQKIFAMVTGLGYTFIAKGIKAAILRIITKNLYKTALKCCKTVFFQNPDDMREFVNAKIVDKDKCVLINGSGVNLEKFKPQPLPDRHVFLMICRILRDKGVIEYLGACRKIKANYPHARFQLLGPFDSNPNSLSYTDIKPYVDGGIIEYLGETKDVRRFIAGCSVYVLPSYREGTPRTVLEAMATGRPIITTDAPGCRETVRDGVNGFLVPVKDSDTLAEKMAWMIENHEKACIMAQESLRICREKYDVNKVNSVILKAMGL